MTENDFTATAATPIDLTDGDDTYGYAAPAPRQPFTPDYTPQAGTRILRAKLRPNAGGVAEAVFTGTLDARTLWTERGASGRLSVYAEVTGNADGAPELQTTLRIALVPTGKRVPEQGRRIGSAGGTHAYLLDATVGPVPEPDVEADADPADTYTDDGYRTTY